MRMIARLGFPLFFASIGSAVAADPCDNPPMAQSELNACAYSQFQSEDAILNETYAKAMVVMQRWDDFLDEGDRGAVDTLREAQRAWIAYRDAACKSAAFPTKGGSVSSMVESSCLADLTRERTQVIIDLLGYYEG